MTEALSHPHNQARRVFWQQQGVDQPAPAVRLQGMAGDPPAVADSGGQGPTIVAELGLDWQSLQEQGAV